MTPIEAAACNEAMTDVMGKLPGDLWIIDQKNQNARRMPQRSHRGDICKRYPRLRSCRRRAGVGDRVHVCGAG